MGEARLRLRPRHKTSKAIRKRNPFKFTTTITTIPPQHPSMLTRKQLLCTACSAVSCSSLLIVANKAGRDEAIYYSWRCVINLHGAWVIVRIISCTDVDTDSKCTTVTLQHQTPTSDVWLSATPHLLVRMYLLLASVFICV